MRAIDRLYKKEKFITRSIHIDEDLYEKLQYLADNIYDATVSKIINVCIEDFLEKGDYKFYKRPKGVSSLYRSLLIRESFYKELDKVKDETGISLTRLLNSAIKKFLTEYDKEF